MGILEEGKEYVINQKGKESVINQNKPLPLKLLQFLLLFLSLGIAFSFLSMCLVRNSGTQSAVIRSRREINRFSLDLQHGMNDNELFLRVSQRKNYNFKGTPKIAFMFLTRGPLPLAPLWERFFQGNQEFYSIYIHTLPSYKSDFPASSVFHGRKIPSQVAEWGKMNMIDAERRLLANALLDISNEWFVLLSESCIPLHNFRIVYRHISESRYSFMSVFDDPGPVGRGRYNKRMSPQVNVTEWRKGSQWFEVNRKLAIDIVKDEVYYPIFEKFCRPPCYVDEHYLPTMMTIRYPRLLANRSITLVDWSRGGPHPATFGKADITDQFFKRILEGGHTCAYNDNKTSLCDLFARKFAPSTLNPLLNYSSKFLGF